MQFSLFAQVSTQRFPDQKIRNINQYSAGIGLVRALPWARRLVVYASLFVGKGKELSAAKHLGRSFVGARLGGQLSLREKAVLRGSVSYQYSRYGLGDPIFIERRDDHFAVARLAMEYTIAPNWRLSPEVQYSNNNSSRQINTFDRWQSFLTIRSQF